MLFICIAELSQMNWLIVCSCYLLYVICHVLTADIRLSVVVIGAGVKCSHNSFTS